MDHIHGYIIYAKSYAVYTAHDINLRKIFYEYLIFFWCNETIISLMLNILKFASASITYFSFFIHVSGSFVE